MCLARVRIAIAQAQRSYSGRFYDFPIELLLQHRLLMGTFNNVLIQPSCSGHIVHNIITDIDECSNSSFNNCDSNAECEDTIGSFQCSCLRGFSGDGTICSGD